MDFFTPLSSGQLGKMDAVQSQHLSKIQGRATTKEVTLIRLNAAAFQASSLRMAMPGSKPLDFNKTQLETRSPTEATWYGKLSGIPGTAILVIRDGNVTGSVRDNGNLYSIEPLGQGVHALIKVDQSKFPEDEPPSFREKQSQNPAPLPEAKQSASQADGPTVINVLVAYTAAARSAVGDIAATIDLAVAEANQSYINSNINIRLAKVNTFEVGYSESGKSYGQIVQDFKGMNDVVNNRNITAADMSVLIVNQTDYCGMADAIMANASSAFAAVHIGCATGYYSFAHELGHLQGARHDIANDPTQQPFPYGHGFQHTSPTPAWRTIMAYNCVGNCDRLQYWSNPSVTYNGYAMGNVGAANNARVLNETAATVAGFRNSQAYTRCADEHQTCTVSGTRNIAYGANGKFVYRTVTGSFVCDNSTFGDPLPGTPKACYAGKIGYAYCTAEHQNCTFAGTQSITYGAGTKFAHKLVANSVMCDNGSFGDPNPGVVKACYSGPAGYAYCSAQNGQCAVNGTQTVAYGANGQFFYRTVSGPIACTDAAFGDPAYGIGKACFVGPAL
ncbi:M12 family metallo-peptidase [Massilia sp. erpn]|uniref:M12 family metallo-peptidase n=1 Tax=Massilia sp. erpn TaxID=2738142 RepID=UPI002104259C|nr:M12 family metallo-peptidase [Massilia sp. erpn]UTY57400.1 hypothetical protein HPQ68_09460 [Massilia sp. erpn]